MNLNDPNLYFVVVFKYSIYYRPERPEMLLRDVFMLYTKDGFTTNRGTQEIFLLSQENYKKMLKTAKTKEDDETIYYDRDTIRSLSSHAFTSKGYRKLSPKQSVK